MGTRGRIAGFAAAVIVFTLSIQQPASASKQTYKPAAREQARAAVTWGACGVTTSTSKVLRTYDGVAGIRRVYLKCGGPKYTKNPTWGYRQILRYHRTDFENLVAGTAQNWRDIADVGMGGALRDPDVRGAARDGKRCFSRKIYLYNLQTGELVHTKIVRVVFRTSDAAIITAYPASRQC